MNYIFSRLNMLKAALHKQPEDAAASVKKHGKTGVIVQAVSAALLGAAVVCGVIFYYYCRKAGYAVSYEGKFLGFVRDSQKAADAVYSVVEELKSKDPSIYIEDVLCFQEVTVNSDKLTDISAIGDEVKSDLYKKFTAYAITVDGVMEAVVDTEDEANQVINGVKEYYRDLEGKSGSEVLDVTIKDDINVESRILGSSQRMDVQKAIDTLVGSDEEDKTYLVNQGDTLSGISKANGMKMEDIASANPGMDINSLIPGQAVKLSVNIPLLNIETTSHITDIEKIAFGTEYTSDSSLFKGQSKVLRDGEYGMNRIVSEVVKLNGREVSKKILNTDTVKLPVPQLVARGTKDVIGNGNFLWPARGHVTSGYGYRADGFHSGMDICAPEGTTIYAADGGKVIQAGWYYGYGNLVIIDHGNGFTTYYGHCSKIFVSQGQSVLKAQEIAAVGHTGDASANHVHFEVRVNGKTKNPASYLK